ncbi:hypothetical protein EDD18DRAFT_1334646 [Armillaria luteobubalina]|uniref:Uncharacterized protein n=1 Tax=Armillaria luteobubalina TaxID=153913 RepID=A0AA39PWP5_9AGAR|nr:hypothetical protein EDD18DRAFT_1334646 [Armillaria luteobubalina]
MAAQRCLLLTSALDNVETGNEEKSAFSVLHSATALDSNHEALRVGARRRKTSGSTQEMRLLKQSMELSLHLVLQPAHAATSSKRRVDVNLLNVIFLWRSISLFFWSKLRENDACIPQNAREHHNGALASIGELWRQELIARMSMLLGEDSLSVRSRVAISNGYMSSTVVYIVASVVPAAGPRPNTHVPVTEVIVGILFSMPNHRIFINLTQVVVAR